MITEFESGHVKDFGDLKGQHTLFPLASFITFDHPARKTKHKWNLEGAVAHVADDGTITVIWPDGTCKPIPFVGAKHARTVQIMTGDHDVLLPIKDGKVVFDHCIVAPWSNYYSNKSNTVNAERRWERFQQFINQ